MIAAAAALWLAGLWLAAPLLRGTSYGRADRLRDALVVGVAIPFVLALLHLLYPAALWIALVACALGGIARARAFPDTPQAHEPVPYLLVASLAIVVWPGLMRPLLEGDSLAYHLPNAAMWAHAHSFAPTTTLYWWYPPASELFASALLCVAGPFALPCAGALAVILLGLRIETYLRDRIPGKPLLADACAAAVVTIPAIAFQAGTLDNDVWLAAFLLETLVTPSVAAAAVVALVKPFGWLLTALALAAKRAPRGQWLAGGAAIAFWFAHDALANPHAAIPIGATAIANLWGTGIAEHGARGFSELLRVLVTRSPFALVAFLCALTAPLLVRTRRALAFVATLTALWFLVMPFGYDNSIAQLADGTSLRFAAAAFALGALTLTLAAHRASRVLVPLYALAALFGAYTVSATFWNDAPTRSNLGVALLALAICAFAAHRGRRYLVPGAAAFAVAVGAALAANAPVPFYADATAVGGARSGVFAWLAEQRPLHVVTWGMRSGIVTVLSPRTRTFDTPSGVDACTEARNDGAVLVTMTERDNPALAPARRSDALRCGTVLYQDPLAVVAQP